MKHYLKVGDNSRATEQDIILNVDCDSTYVNVCWLGVITNEEACFGDDVQTYCESIYIGVNTSCSEEKEVNGTIPWYDCIITYKIIQSKRTDCKDCGSVVTSCQLINAYVNPYYVSYDDRRTTIYYQYWETLKDNCKVISRTIRNASREVSINPSTVSCTASTRTISVPSIDYCGGRIEGLSCYVQKPDNCCDQSGNEDCYEIGDIYYNPQKVDSSGGTVDFYFDYKKNTFKDCKKTESFGRFQDSVMIQRCVGNECCKEKTITKTYNWTNHTLCSGGNQIKLEIKRKKDLNYTGQCKCEVDNPDIGYCVNMQSIKKYYKNNRNVWTEITDSNPYVFPYYGGTMKVSWQYSAITVYDNCTSAVTKGNIWEDYVDILPYVGTDCDDGIPDSARIEYTFKKSPCSFKEDAKEILPENICSGNNCKNVFHIDYEQYKKPCSDTCNSCLTKFNINFDSGETSSSDTAICDVTLSSKPEWVDVSVNGRNVTYSVLENSGSTRNGGVLFKLDGDDCYDTVIIKQTGARKNSDTHPDDPTIECNCESAFFEVYPPTNELDKNGGERKTIGTYIYNDCITNVTGDSGCYITIDNELDCDGGNANFTINTGGKIFINNVTFEEGMIYATVDKNTTNKSRSCSITITYDIKDCSGGGHANLTVTQKG